MRNNKLIGTGVALVTPFHDDYTIDFASLERLIEHFDELMQEVEFYETDNPRQLLTRVRRFFKRSKLDHMEANIFRGVFAAIQKKLKR